MVSLMDNPKSVLEVGAGTQELEKHLDCDYVSCDLEPRFRPNVIGDAHNLPFKDGAFDAVVTKNLLQHLPSYRKALSEMMRVAKKQIVLAERTWERPTEVVSVNESGVIRRRFNRANLMEILGEWGEASFKPSEADGRIGIYLGEAGY